jgi:malonate transporter MadL subunit
LGVAANVGGVGFAMMLLVIVNDKLKQKNLLQQKTEDGLNFWNQMYIPIVVAMSAIQNVKVAITSGMVAILSGIIPAAFCLLAVRYISTLSPNLGEK